MKSVEKRVDRGDCKDLREALEHDSTSLLGRRATSNKRMLRTGNTGKVLADAIEITLIFFCATSRSFCVSCLEVLCGLSKIKFLVEVQRSLAPVQYSPLVHTPSKLFALLVFVIPRKHVPCKLSWVLPAT